MVHLYLCHMVIVQELPNNKKVATQYKFTIFNLGVRLYKNIFLKFQNMELPFLRRMNREHTIGSTV